MGRAPAIALRLKSLINWPNNVRHPFLSEYIKHIFQHYHISEPGIRASTTGIWVNVTLLQTAVDQDPSLHPRVKNPVLVFNNVDLSSALGRLERRIKRTTSITQGAKKEPSYLTKVAAGTSGHLIGEKLRQGDALQALQIYKDVPIHLKINIINNPLLDAQCLANFIAAECKKGVANFPKIYKTLLKSLK